MKAEATEPTHAPDLAQFRLVDMYSSCTDTDTKRIIMEQFTKPSQLRIVIATIAFGMGIDCPDVQSIIHLGPSDDLESYIQETGRAGQTAYAKLLITKQWKRYADDSMKMYIENDSKCRREVLFCDMEGYHAIPFERLCLCCDICQNKSLCDLCTKK